VSIDLMIILQSSNTPLRHRTTVFQLWWWLLHCCQQVNLLEAAVHSHTLVLPMQQAMFFSSLFLSGAEITGKEKRIRSHNT
jgi:hypothetical protein